MKTQPGLISVIMAVWNDARFLRESIESILDQTYGEFEFIIIDDNSTDESLTIIKEYVAQDQRIKLIQNPENYGLTKSLNIGLVSAAGEFVARQDGDDVSLPDRLEKQVQFLLQHPDIFLIGSGIKIIIDENSQEIRRENLPFGWDQIKPYLQTNNPFVHSAIMFRNQGYRYRDKFTYAQDYDFYLNLASASLKMENLKAALIKYRYNPNAISTKKRSLQQLFKQKAVEFYLERMKRGDDSYAIFHPVEEIYTNRDNSPQKQAEGQIWYYKKVGDYVHMRKLLLEYLKKYHKANFKFRILFLLSFFPLNLLLRFI